MATDAEVEALKERVDLLEAAIEAIHEAEDGPAKEAARVLAQLAVQAAEKIERMESLDETIRDSREALFAALDQVDQLATVEQVRDSFEATRREQAGKRKLTTARLAFGLLWVMLLFGWTVNERIEHCSPGTKANRVVVLILRTDVRVDDLRDAAREPVPAWCDATIPFRAHSTGDTWPTPGNLIGVAAHAALVAVTIAAVRRRRWEDDTDHDIRAAHGVLNPDPSPDPEGSSRG